MKKNIPLFLFTLFVLGTGIYAKSGKIDSLRSVLKTQLADSNKVRTLNALSSEFETISKHDSAIVYARAALALAKQLTTSADEALVKAGKKGMSGAYGNLASTYAQLDSTLKAIDFCQKALNIEIETGDKYDAAVALNGIGNLYVDVSDFPKAFDYYMKGAKAAEDIGNKQLQANSLGNIGLLYGYESNFPLAIDFDLKALKLAQELGNKTNLAADLGNIGIIYWDEGDTTKALDYCRQAIKLNEETKDTASLANNLGNVGAIYTDKKCLEKGMYYFKKALSIAQKNGDKKLQATILGNIGNVYGAENKFTEALDYYTQALKLAESLQDRGNIAVNIGNIGELYTCTGKFKDAEEYLKKAIAIDDSIDDKNGVMHFENSLSKLYDTTGRYQLAFEYYKKAKVIEDTMFNADKNKAITSRELTFQFEQKQAEEKAEQDKKNLVEEQDKRREHIIRNVLIAGFLLLLVFAFVVYKGYRDKKKDNVIITHQKELVEEKQKEILDSIHYAQRIQKALLASDNLLRKNLNEYFVLYKPKDIVSGDFYWATTKNDKFYLAVCDSTGHGVPGAFMSLLNISFLNEAITEKGIMQPNEVLNHTRKRLIENISQDGQQDGMDGTLLCFDKLTLQYAGAYNSPLIIRGGKIAELPVDKIPVGKSPKENEPFTHHTFTLQKGDVIYAYTDGYADQFGGPKGKKFKKKQLQDKILEISNLSMAEQRSRLEQILDSWREDLEQVDDILIIGIRV